MTDSLKEVTRFRSLLFRSYIYCCFIKLSHICSMNYYENTCLIHDTFYFVKHVAVIRLLPSSDRLLHPCLAFIRGPKTLFRPSHPYSRYSRHFIPLKLHHIVVIVQKTITIPKIVNKLSIRNSSIFHTFEISSHFMFFTCHTKSN